MKDKPLGVKASMQLPKKRLVSKAPLPAADMGEQVERLHSKEVVRLSLDVPSELYKQLKSHHFQQGYRTTRSYLLALIEQDLGS